MHHIHTIILSFLLALTIANSAHAEENLSIIKLDVSGMSSPACPKILASAVKHMNGVKAVDASLEQHSATIEFDASRTSLKDIQDTIYQQAGFSTQAVDTH